MALVHIVMIVDGPIERTAKNEGHLWILLSCPFLRYIHVEKTQDPTKRVCDATSGFTDRLMTLRGRGTIPRSREKNKILMDWKPYLDSMSSLSW